jgi:2-oxoglutarate dehydrogenase E1 component
MLRLKAATSATEELTGGVWQPVVDPGLPTARTVLLCSGKVYYDLMAGRAERGHDDVAVVRVEQLYPLAVDELGAIAARYPQADLVWVQEEPANMGAWPFMALHLPEALGRPVRRVSRPSSASPATGSHRIHEQEQADLVESAFNG